jgi:hypothetical protein
MTRDENSLRHPGAKWHHEPMLVLVRVGLVALVAGLVAIVGACGDDTCDSSQCAAGNQCLALNGETKCRKTCSSNTDAATSCPFGYTCTDLQNGAPAFCVASKAQLTPKATGQWGFGCQANLGAANPACDGAQGFYCYGISPTDASAYCTRYDCTADDECGPGFWCATINQQPNVLTAARGTVGATQRVCLQRSYCAACKADVDCPTVKGVAQHCIGDLGGGMVCVPECDDSSNCPNEAECLDANFAKKVCYPRAKRCVGDGTICSPCRSDADCKDGACLKGQYTTEHVCATRANSCSDCPATIASPSRKVGCTTKGSDALPAGYCTGVYALGGDNGSDIGCWTPDR